LRELKPFPDPNLLVGRDLADDAAVYRLSDDTAVVSTVDVFTPIHDDPYTFGQIAAANCLSDVYAMGARPLVALNVACWPADQAPLEMLAEILRGGGDKCAEAGVPIGGGHTMRAPEPAYGLAVTGIVHPDKIITNAGARPGDALVLTKPLGSGIITTGAMADAADESVVAEAAAVMMQLNRAASEAMIALGASAATDITGFGLIGHAYELAAASGVEAHIEIGTVPLMRGVLELVAQWALPLGLFRNMDHYGPHADFGGAPEALTQVMCDPQTSGGLLIAIAAERSGDLLAELSSRGVSAARIGEVREGAPGRVVFE